MFLEFEAFIWRLFTEVKGRREPPGRGRWRQVAAAAAHHRRLLLGRVVQAVRPEQLPFATDSSFAACLAAVADALLLLLNEVVADRAAVGGVGAARAVDAR